MMRASSVERHFSNPMSHPETPKLGRTAATTYCAYRNIRGLDRARLWMMVFPAHAGLVREGDEPFEHQPNECAVLSVRLELVCVAFHLAPCLSVRAPRTVPKQVTRYRVPR